MFARFMRSSFHRYFSFSVLLALLWAFGGMHLLTGCANISPPMGGARDSLPPNLLKMSPADSTLNFTAKKIEFSFDEYVQLDNIFDNVLVNPPLNRFPTIDSKLRTVTVLIKDTLKPETTYSIDFGKAIKDVNEGNPLKGFTYVFSTGNTIDSLELTGRVVNAETGQPDSTLIVILHTSMDDSAVAKEKPVYVSRLDGKGNFLFKYLPAKTFRIFALKDEGFKQYQDPTTPFAFADSAVNPAGNVAPMELRFFTIPDSAKAEENTANQQGNRVGGRKAKPADDEDNKRLLYTTSAKDKSQDILKPLSINFTEPIAVWDSSKIKLTDTLFRPVAVGHFVQDSVSITLPVAWKSSTAYALVLEKGFATDSAGATNAKNDTTIFTTKAESEYGAVRMKFSGVDFARKPLLFWIQNNTLVRKTPLQPGELRINLIEPGQYTLRIVYDENGNGNWDTGNYWEKRQPEHVIAFPKEINVRPNWDNEFQFDL